MWLGQSPSPAPSPVELIQYGVLGMVVVALIAGWLWAKPAVDRLLADKDRLITERSQEIEALTREVSALSGQVKDLSEQIRRMERRGGEGSP